MIYFGNATSRRDSIKPISVWVIGLKIVSLPFLTILRFIYCWSAELTSINFCERHLEMNHCTVVDWNNYMREVCTITINRNQQTQIGGPGKIV